MDSKVYLGTGLKFPLEIPRGKGSLQSNNNLIQQSVRIILDTPVGERLFLPAFGSRLTELLFEPNDEILQDLLGYLITEALNAWEKRIKTLQVSTEVIKDAVICTIAYRVLQSNEVESYIYPFYKKTV